MTEIAAEDGQRTATPWLRPASVAQPKPVGSLFNLFLVALSPLLLLATLLAVFVPGFYVAVSAPDVDAVLSTATTVAAAAVAMLAWIRFREADQRDALYQSAAFLVLFAGGAISLVLLLTGADVRLGFSGDNPGQAPLYLSMLERLSAALLLLAGALSQLNRWPRPTPRLATAIALGPTLLLLIAAGLIIRAPDLPPLVAPVTLDLLSRPTDLVNIAQLSLPLFAVQLIVAGLFLSAAYAYARQHASDRSPYTAYLEVALIVAAFGQMHAAIVPGAYNGIVASADVLRLGFYALLLLGVAHAARHDLAALREANLSLRRLQSAETQRIASEERARVARDIHDGLLQELWLARLTIAGFKDMPKVPPDARRLTDKVDGILEDALAEARFAVATLQPSEASTLGADLQRLVDDYADHFGLEIELTVDNDPVDVPDEARSEILRICREALNNVRKHADASVVRVTLRSDGRSLRLMVSDNGKGFDPDAVDEGYGLSGMRQRTQAIGGALFVESEPQNGTRVIVEIPVAAHGRE